jgi:hypothetical protein
MILEGIVLFVSLLLIGFGLAVGYALGHRKGQRAGYRKGFDEGVEFARDSRRPHRLRSRDSHLRILD